jgi:tRNA modification GTPase
MVQGLTEAIIDLRTYVEAAIDFPEEELDFLADRELTERLNAVKDHFNAVEQSARQGRLLREGMTVVIAGRPNAGKSSLMNRLAGYDAAIVTPIPGTTRDILRERIHIDGMPLHVLDTAGLREAGDAVEAEGIRRAQAEMSRADRVLFVIDAVEDPAGSAYHEERQRLPREVPVTLILNKSDMAPAIALPDTLSGPPRISLSALTGKGVDTLRTHLKSCMGYHTLDAGTVSARRRHLDALEKARAHVHEASRQLSERRAGELVAEELRQAQDCLSEITGEFTSDDLLGRIFSSFCIGK